MIFDSFISVIAIVTMPEEAIPFGDKPTSSPPHCGIDSFSMKVFYRKSASDSDAD